MTLKKWIKQVFPIVDVTIYTQDDDEPAFTGSALDIPWYMVDYQIGREKDNDEEPIYITTQLNSFGHTVPAIVINLIAT